MTKSRILYALVGLIGLTMASCNSGTGGGGDVSSITSEKDSLSYALGIMSGNRFSQDNLQLNLDMYKAGIRTAMDSTEALMDETQARNFIRNYFETKQKRESANFLKDNASKPGVTVTETGLQYEIINPGNGPSPTLTDTVVVHYTGRLTNGKVFDSSVERGQPATFGVGQVIPGWTEALQMMSAGAKYNLVIPSELAYGERGAGRDIGPDETLLFEVELLEIK